jgi:spore coat protein A, manganese oxidase
MATTAVPIESFAQTYKTEVRPLPPHELGPKDTIQCNPGESTRVLMKFEGGTGQYVYHCHILEH